MENRQRSRAKDAGGRRALSPFALATRVLRPRGKGGAPRSAGPVEDCPPLDRDGRGNHEEGQTMAERVRLPRDWGVKPRAHPLEQVVWRRPQVSCFFTHLW
jgi:hypothetical protein